MRWGEPLADDKLCFTRYGTFLQAVDDKVSDIGINAGRSYRVRRNEVGHDTELFLFA